MFGVLWRAVRGRLDARYTFETANGRELLLTPVKQGLVKSACVSPLAEYGKVLKIRFETDDLPFGRVRARLNYVASKLPVEPQMSWERLPNAPTCWDLLVPLQLVLGTATTASEQAARLYEQVAPVFDLLDVDYFELTDRAADED